MMRHAAVLHRVWISLAIAGFRVLASDPDAPDSRPLVCVHASEAPVLDGRLDEELWSRAPQIPLLYNGDERVDRPCGRARLAYDNLFLYAAFEVEDKDVFSFFENRDDPLWHEDVVEIFVKPSVDSRVYYEYQFSPAGQIFDARWPSFSSARCKSLRYKRWDGGAEWAVFVKGSLNQWQDRDDGWQIEIRIPLVDFRDAIDNPQALKGQWHGLVTMYDFSAHRDNKFKAASTPIRGFHMFQRWQPIRFGSP